MIPKTKGRNLTINGRTASIFSLRSSLLHLLRPSAARRAFSLTPPITRFAFAFLAGAPFRNPKGIRAISTIHGLPFPILLAPPASPLRLTGITTTAAACSLRAPRTHFTALHCCRPIFHGPILFLNDKESGLPAAASSSKQTRASLALAYHCQSQYNHPESVACSIASLLFP